MEDNFDFKQELKAFRGNPQLKRIGERINFTEDQILEIKKCIDDPIYFANNYVKVVSINEGLIQIKLYEYQKNLIRTMQGNRFVICTASRQCGKSVASLIFLLWLVLFHPDTSVALLANKGATARMILARIQLAYYHLPKFLQQGIMEWNKGSIHLENNSRIIAAATSSDSIRGESFNCVTGDTELTIQFSDGTIKTMTMNSLENYIKKENENEKL